MWQARNSVIYQCMHLRYLVLGEIRSATSTVTLQIPNLVNSQRIYFYGRVFSGISHQSIHVKSPDLGGRLPLFYLISLLRSSHAREPPNDPTFFKPPAFVMYSKKDNSPIGKILNVRVILPVLSVRNASWVIPICMEMFVMKVCLHSIVFVHYNYLIAWCFEPSHESCSC